VVRARSHSKRGAQVPRSASRSTDGVAVMRRPLSVSRWNFYSRASGIIL
jgi:hypothetical protein